MLIWGIIRFLLFLRTRRKPVSLVHMVYFHLGRCISIHCNAPTIFQHCMMPSFLNGGGYYQGIHRWFLSYGLFIWWLFGSLGQHIAKIWRAQTIAKLGDVSHQSQRRDSSWTQNFEKGIKLYKAKIEVAEKLHPPNFMKGIGNFKGHAYLFK